MAKSTIAQRMQALGVSLESAELTIPAEVPEVQPEAMPMVDGGQEEVLAFHQADQQMGQAEEVLDQLQDDHEQLGEVAVTLESFLKSNTPMTAGAAAMASIAVRGATRRYGLVDAVPAMECFATGQTGALANTRVALESVSGKMKQLKEWILSIIDKLKEAWDKFITATFDRFSWLKRMAEQLLKNSDNFDATTFTHTAFPAEKAVKLQINGELSKNIPSDLIKMKNLMEKIFHTYSGPVQKELSDYVTSISAQLDKYRQAGADGEGFNEFLASGRALQEKLTEDVLKIVTSQEAFKLDGDKYLSEEQLGGWVVAITETMDASVEHSSHYVEEVSGGTKLMNPDQIKDVCNALIGICDAVIGYRNTANNRNKITDQLATIVKPTDVNTFDDQLASALTRNLRASISIAKGVDRPVIAAVSSVCFIALQYASMSLGDEKATA